MDYLIGHIIDIVCAATGIVALVRAGRCAHGRLAIRVAGGVLVLYALISIAWYLWVQFVYWPEYESVVSPATAENPILRLYDILMPVRTILGSLLLVATIALLITALVIRGRREFAQSRPPGPQPVAPYGGAPYAAAQYGAAYGAPGQYQQPQPQQPPQQAWPAPHGAAARDQRPAPGQWPPPPGPGQSPPHGAPPPETPEGGAR